MSGPVNGVDALVVVLVIVALAVTLWVAQWRRWNAARVMRRRVTVNYWRSSGRRP